MLNDVVTAQMSLERQIVSLFHHTLLSGWGLSDVFARRPASGAPRYHDEHPCDECHDPDGKENHPDRVQIEALGGDSDGELQDRAYNNEGYPGPHEAHSRFSIHGVTSVTGSNSAVAGTSSITRVPWMPTWTLTKHRSSVLSSRLGRIRRGWRRVWIWCGNSRSCAV